MKYRSPLALALIVVGACVGPNVEVTPLHPAPHALAPRAADSVKLFEAAPAAAVAVAVYRIEATGGGEAELTAAVRDKAAGLGCDGFVITQTLAKPRTQGAEQTGALNDHREVTAAHVSALCLVTTGGGEPAPRTGSR